MVVVVAAAAAASGLCPLQPNLPKWRIFHSKPGGISPPSIHFSAQSVGHSRRCCFEVFCLEIDTDSAIDSVRSPASTFVPLLCP